MSAVQTYTDLGFPAKYLDTQFYPRLLLGGTEPPAGPPEESYLVFIGPFKTKGEAEDRCNEIFDKTQEPCVSAQADPQ